MMMMRSTKRGKDDNDVEDSHSCDEDVHTEGPPAL